MTNSKVGLFAKLSVYSLVVILLLAFAGVAAFAVLSDNSIHGLTLRFYEVSWQYSCTAAYPALVYTFGSVVVYSSNSLPTSLSKVLFLMSTNGMQVGSVTGADSSFGPGQSSAYRAVQFSNSVLSPSSAQVTSLISVAISAQVSAGLYSSQISTSFSQIVHLPSLTC